MSRSSGAPFRLLIFGCGYVGSALAHAALARQWQVTALTRNADRAGELERADVRVARADLASDAWHGVIPREQDAIVNCVSSGGGGLDGYRRSYVDGTKSILAWAGEKLPATFVYTGSTSVYPQSGGEVVTEDSPTGGGSEASAPLLEAEHLIRESQAFARWFILRLSGIYGPGRHFLLDQLRAGAAVFPGTGAHRLNLVHRDDIVAAILAAIAAPPQVRDAMFNVSGDTAATKSEFAAWLARELGVPPPAFQRDLPSPLPVPVARGRSGPVPDRLISNARIKAVLGWRPRYPDFRDGYRAILNDLRAQTDQR